MPVKNTTRRKILASHVNMCDSTASRAKGLMFHKPIKDLAFILAFQSEQFMALHMFFVFFPIDVLFLNADKVVVEMKEHFQPFTQYIAEHNAKYAVELPDGTISATKTKVGDRIEFPEAAVRRTAG